MTSLFDRERSIYFIVITITDVFCRIEILLYAMPFIRFKTLYNEQIGTEPSRLDNVCPTDDTLIGSDIDFKLGICNYPY